MKMHYFAKPECLFIVSFSFFTLVSWQLTLNFIFHYIIAHCLQNSFLYNHRNYIPISTVDNFIRYG